MSDTTDRDDRDDRDERVRRLLAEARHDGAVPTDVAVRLDRVLEQLAQGDTRGLRTLDELAARRRRARGLLVAAAAVAVVGIGLGQVIPGAFEGAASDIPAGAAESADREALVADDRLEGAASGRTAEEAAPSDADAPTAFDGAHGSLSDGVAPELAGEAGTDDQARSTDSSDLSASSMATARGRALVVAAGRPVELRAERFVRDALRARTRLDTGRRGRASDRDFDCDLAAWGPGTGLAVRYGGRPHVLVFREPAGETQVVDLLQCGTGEILRSTTLPAD